MSNSILRSGATLALLFASGIVHAQDTWSTRAEMGFVAARGNSSTETANAKVEIARNGREALAHLAQKPGVDLVLMDIMMGEMDGLEATREIRKQPQLAKLPIIALTAKAMADDREQCLAAGANDYIAKPFDVDKLLSLARVWMPK